MASHEVLQAFVQAATHGSFSAAARKLGKSQSTVSAAVASLEIDLDVVLFDRSSRKPTLTPAGHVLLQRAEQVLEASSRLELAASQLAQGLAVLHDLGLPDDGDHVNPNGGAIALGHPLGMSGARLGLTLVEELHRRDARYGLATMCIGVGQGIAMVVERV